MSHYKPDMSHQPEISHKPDISHKSGVFQPAGYNNLVSWDRVPGQDLDTIFKPNKERKPAIPRCGRRRQSGTEGSLYSDQGSEASAGMPPKAYLTEAELSVEKLAGISAISTLLSWKPV